MHALVIGGGILGAGIAYHLTRHGASTALVERYAEGQATAAAAGIVAPWSRAAAEDPWRPLALGAARHYPWLLAELAAEGAPDPGYARVGGISLASAPETAAPVRQWVEELRGGTDPCGAGEPAGLAPGEPARRFPVLDSAYAGTWVPGTGRVDGRMLRSALLAAAEARGLHRYEGSAALLVERGRCVGARVGAERVEAETVVLAAGAWSADLLAPHGISLGVRPQRGQILHLRLPGYRVADWPTVRAENGEYYLLSFPDDRIVAGATRESGTGFDHRVTAEGLSYLLNTALELAPGLAGATVLETRVGFRPVSTDGLPLLGPLEALPGVVVATGMGAVGLTFGPYSGSVIADHIAGAPHGLDLRPYRPERL